VRLEDKPGGSMVVELSSSLQLNIPDDNDGAVEDPEDDSPDDDGVGDTAPSRECIWTVSKTSALSLTLSMASMDCEARLRAVWYPPTGRRARVWEMREWMTSVVWLSLFGVDQHCSSIGFIFRCGLMLISVQLAGEQAIDSSAEMISQRRQVRTGRHGAG
jgi:hypothetical protein